MEALEKEGLAFFPLRENQYDIYLSDESRVAGVADTISFPSGTEEIAGTLKYLFAKKIPVTVQGSRTGVTAGAVPFGGHVMNLSRMNKITGIDYNKDRNAFYIRVQPGVLLKDMREALKEKEFDTRLWTAESWEAYHQLRKSGSWFFPPDPTETTASIGGLIACNASGPLSYFYGSVRPFIYALTLVLSDGTVFKIKRGEFILQGRTFTLQLPDKLLKGKIPSYSMPDVKNASGYYADENMDIIDLFSGSEGSLGVVAEAEITLLPEPNFKFGIMVFFREEQPAVNLVITLRKDKGNKAGKPVAIEFFDSNSLDLLRQIKITDQSYSIIPEMKRNYHSAVYLEYHCDYKGDADTIIDDLATKGISTDDTWVATNSGELERMRFFRHSVPEAVNNFIGRRRKTYPEITKLGTDMAVPDICLREIMEMYHTGIAEAGLYAVKFGHIGNNHIHVNILPETKEEYDRGKLLYMLWAEKIIALGGTISAEHGIGKMKRELLHLMYGDKGIQEMIEVKSVFDPEHLLNRGTLFNI